MSSVTSYVVIVAGDELVLVGDQLHLVLHPQVVSKIVAVPKDLGATELKEKFINVLTMFFLFFTWHL